MTSAAPVQLLIVGAGLCGLSLARQITDAALLPAVAAAASTNAVAASISLVILEKSRGVGGRMATRRSSSALFDHGAQFYYLKPALRMQHQYWQQASLVQPFLAPDPVKGQRYRCMKGMTALAKALVAHDLTVKLEQKVIAIQRVRRSDEQGDVDEKQRSQTAAQLSDNKSTSFWRLQIENQNESIDCQTLVLTCPLPQAIELLDKCQIVVDDSLRRIVYHKALVALFEGVQSEARLTGTDGFADHLMLHNSSEESPIYTIVDHVGKQQTASAMPHAWSVTMNPAFSDRNYNEKDDANLQAIVQEVRRLDPSFTYQGAPQLKKWRYSHPASIHEQSFVQVAENLYLAGDSFGGASLHGAAKSANALFEALKQKSESL